MPKPVVDLLKIVNIDHAQPHWHEAQAGEQLACLREDAVAIGKAGQRVVLCAAERRGIALDRLQRDDDARAQRTHHFAASSVIGGRPGAVEQHGVQGSVSGAQGYEHQGTPAPQGLRGQHARGDFRLCEDGGRVARAKLFEQRMASDDLAHTAARGRKDI